MSIFSELGMRGGANKSKEEFLYNVASCYALLEKEIASVLAPYDLSPVKINALLAIKHIGKDKGISQAEICKRMIVTAGNMTGLVDRLEMKKWVQRFSQSRDRRVNLVRITRRGSILLDRVWPIYKNKVEQLISLSKGDLAQVVSSLGAIRENIKNGKKET